MRSASPKRLSHGRRAAWATAGVLLDQGRAHRPLDLAKAFGNRRPVELEVGCGKGTFLLARAAGRPEINVLGVDCARTYCAYTADRVRRGGLRNARVLCADAATLLREALAPRSLLRVHVYFPDPWPKRRHRRRRLIQPPFVADARRALILGGQLIVVTDHLDYFQEIRRVLDAADGLLTVPMTPPAERQGELVGSNFERKYAAEGRPVYRTARLRYT
jgi:tRNA (guanine-N7-)-methyltransferase